MLNRIAQIKNYGQSIWLDYLSRDLIQSGKLTQLIKEDGINGVTSNPTIFYQVFSQNPIYREIINRLKTKNLSAIKCYEELVIADITLACDLMLDLYPNQSYGYVSLELSPKLAHNKESTIESAISLWHQINRPNLMIKVPATSAGIAAFEQLTILGINVNITLIFSLAQLKLVWQAYIAALTQRITQGLKLDQIKAVASIFLSRIDSAIDHQLPKELQGKTAINIAKAAYKIYKELFHGESFASCKKLGAIPQYLLWASTGTKNPQYSDLLYVEELIGVETINTMPTATLDNFRDHGIARNSLINDLELADGILAKIEAQGIDLAQLGVNLQQQGLELFSQSYDKLITLFQ